MKLKIFALIGLALNAEAQLFITPNVQVQSNDVLLTANGLPSNAICDVLFSPELGGNAAWTLFYRGSPGQTNFSLPAPGSSAAFFRLRTDFSPVSTLNPLDWDGDGIPNSTEISLGLNPLDPDSDGDGVPDGTDLLPLDPSRWHLLPLNPNDHAPPVITLLEPASAVLIP